MKTRIASIPAVVFLLAGFCAVCTLPLGAEEDVGFTNWTAPPYWCPAPAAPPDEGRLEAQEAQEALAPDALPSQPLPFVAIAPCRLADTRDGTFPGPLGPPALPASVARDFPVTGYCGIPTTAQAVSFNVTVTNTLGAGFILVYPAGGAVPTVSTINYVAGQTIANAAIIPLGTDGKATFIAGVSGTDLILDVNGYYAPQAIVNTVNGLSGALTLAGSSNISVTPSGSTLTFTLGGTAGGSLTGAYPAPTIAAGAVGASQIHDGVVGTNHVANGSLLAADVAAGQVVKSVNTFKDAVTIVGGGGVTVTNASNTVTIAAPAGSMILGTPGDTTIIGQGYTEIGPSGIEFWKPTKTTGAVSRQSHTAVWTGTRMLVWGGRNDTTYRNDGDAYDPATDSWTNMASTGAPAARHIHTAVWSGSHMIVWGGHDGSTFLLSGGVYDPAGTGTWTATSGTGAPNARGYHTAVWSDGYMVVWGGMDNSSSFLSTGGRYAPPPTNSWTATAAGSAPTGRVQHTAISTGATNTMVVWGGFDGTTYVNSGAEYDPSANTWTAIASPGATVQGRANHSAVWTGSKMVVWGGQTSGTNFANTGGIWTRSTDTWANTSVGGAPEGRLQATAVWTGTRMLVWGGVGENNSLLSTGGAFDPLYDVWSPMTSVGAPAGRNKHTMVWTGSQLIVWGGTKESSGSSWGTNTGGVWSQLSIYSKN